MLSRPGFLKVVKPVAHASLFPFQEKDERLEKLRFGERSSSNLNYCFFSPYQEWGGQGWGGKGGLESVGSGKQRSPVFWGPDF
jgi:hypothetical protein